MAKSYLPVRLSHLMRHSSVGSVVRYAAGKGSYIYMVVHDTREWTDKNGNPGGEEILFVEAVKAGLKIDQTLWRPPVPKIKKGGTRGERVEGVCIPATPFPKWARCINEECENKNLLVYKPWEMKNEEIFAFCKCCKSPLEQMPWLMATAEGWMADLDYHFIAHRGANKQGQKNCRKDTHSKYLKIVEKSPGGKVKVYCSRPGCKSTGEFSEQSKQPFGDYTPTQPWIFDSNQDNLGTVMATVMRVNDIRLHSSKTPSALVIPPESKIDQESIESKLYRHPEWRSELERKGSALQIKSRRRDVAGKLDCKIVALEAAEQKLKEGWPYYGNPPTGGELLEKEFEVLCGEAEIEGDFRTEKHTEAWAALGKQAALPSETQKIMLCVDELVAVHRLKEIMILEGFKRVIGTSEERLLVPPDIDGSTGRLPALELYGEGIFFSLSESVIQGWECHSAVQRRAKLLRQRFVNSKRIVDPEPEVSPRFLLLHTLSHLLIRQLESEAGYPAASLKERIYTGENRDAPMAGILIYVAAPDIVGTLGGLAELADPKRFSKLLQGAFEHAHWCSLDPVCGEHDGQGPDRLNQAACHGCTLVPEPSCPYGNILLDRVFLRGSNGSSSDSDMPGLLKFVKNTMGPVQE